MSSTSDTTKQASGRFAAGMAKWLMRILFSAILVFLAFLLYMVIHEAGHLVVDEIQFSNHGTKIKSFDEQILWVGVEYFEGRWSGPFWIPKISSLAKTGSVMAEKPIVLTEYDKGVANIAGSVSTALIALISLITINLLRKTHRFATFLFAFPLIVLFLDQVAYTFLSKTPEPLTSAVLMGIQPGIFKLFVIAFILVEAGLLIRYIFIYGRARKLMR
jgi:hypothetical protein